MRKGLIAAAVAGSLATITAAFAVDPSQRLPGAMAYVEAGFGGSAEARGDRHFFYGLRLDHDRRFGGAPRAPLFQAQFSREGFDTASFNGLPFAMRVRQADQFGTQLEYSLFDYGLAAVGLLGVGYAIFEVVDAEDETPDPTPTPTPPPDDGGGLPLVGDLPLPGLFTESRALPDAADRADPAYQRWLDGGTGQMGDLGG